MEASQLSILSLMPKNKKIRESATQLSQNSLRSVLLISLFFSTATSSANFVMFLLGKKDPDTDYADNRKIRLIADCCRIAYYAITLLVGIRYQRLQTYLAYPIPAMFSVDISEAYIAADIANRLEIRYFPQSNDCGDRIYATNSINFLYALCAPFPFWVAVIPNVISIVYPYVRLMSTRCSLTLCRLLRRQHRPDFQYVYRTALLHIRGQEVLRLRPLRLPVARKGTPTPCTFRR